MCLMNVDADQSNLGSSGTPLRRAYQIKWAKSKKLLDSYIDRYNADRPLREQLRSGHKALAQYLLYLYSLSIAKEQAYGDRVELYRALPPLRTNNVQLSKAMGCSERTIINLRARLKQAKVIEKEHFRGSNASYEVFISGAVIHIQAAGEPENIVHFFHPKAKSLHHTVTRTKQVTNKLIKLDGLDFQQQADFQSNEWKSTVEKCWQSCGKGENVVENQATGSILDTQDTRAGYETVRPGQETPPELRGTPQNSIGQAENRNDQNAVAEEINPVPQSLQQALSGLGKQEANSISRHVQVIWTCALLNLYEDKWIADQEAERAKARLAEYLIYADPSRYQAGTAEILERIILVRRWIERGQQQGIRRWVPLPSRYFDYRNSTGFSKTKPWFKAHIKAKAAIKSKELLTKAIKEYLRSLEPAAKIGPSETYRKISRRLGKYNNGLLNRFHEQIAKVQQAAVHSAAS